MQWVTVASRQRMRIFFLSAAAILAATTIIAVPAAAAPPAPNGDAASGLADDEARQLSRSDALNAAADKLRGLDRLRGYTGAAGDPGANRLTIMWKAPVPAAVQRFDDQLVEGVTIDVKTVQYSEEDLFRASDMLLAASQRGALPVIASITGNEDGSGLVVGVDPAVVPPSARSGLPVRGRSLTGMPIQVVNGTAPQPATRQNDSNPWFGGGMMRHPGFNPPGDLDPYHFCSTAFAAVTPSGYGRLLSARHCDANGDLAWDDGAGDPLTTGGTAVSVKATDDTLLIDPIGGTGGWVHGGPWNATNSHSRYHLKVGGASSPVKDTSVCTSGANSGEHCGLQVQSSTMTSFTCGTGTCRAWVAVNRSQVSVSTVGGDSGGPVYSNRSDGRVQARGVIYGGTANVSCGGVRFTTSKCFQYVYFTDIKRLESAWGVTVETTA